MRRGAPSLVVERMRAMQWGRLHLLPRKRCWQSKEIESSIPCRGGDESNAMRRALLCIEEEVKAMRNGIALVQFKNAVGNYFYLIFRGAALPSCQRELQLIDQNSAPLNLTNVQRLRLLGLVKLDKQLLKVLHHRVFHRSNSRKWGIGGDKGRRIHQQSQGLLDCNSWVFSSQSASSFTSIPLSNIVWLLTSLIVNGLESFITKCLAIHPNAARQHCLASDFSHSERTWDFHHKVPRHSP